MAIDKRILWTKLRDFIHQRYHDADKPLLLELCYKILANNPTKNCFIKGGELIANLVYDQKFIRRPSCPIVQQPVPHLQI